MYAVAVEQDPVAAERMAPSFPNVLSLQFVEEFHGCMTRDLRTKIRNSWVGNGFHIPSLVIVLLLLTSGVRAAPPLQCVFGQHLRETVPGSPFDDAVLRAFPGQRSVDQALDDVHAILAGCPGWADAPASGFQGMRFMSFRV